MDSEAKQKHTPPLLFCPYALFEDEEEDFRWTQFGESPSIPFLPEKISSVSQIRYDSLDSILCPFCSKSLVGSTIHSCERCRKALFTYAPGYHKECLKPISKHPYHPKHSLRPRANYSPRFPCLCCSNLRDWVYSCLVCVFTICADCAKQPPLLAINHPKRHEHTLLFFPRKQSLICDVCGLSDDGNRFFIYSCLQCDFIVHKGCVYFPCIIKISRHEHRISFNSSLTPENWLCGVCRGKIDTKYGRYSCVKNCSYGVHSKCATRKDVWDGKELEGTSEEDVYKDIKSFSDISDGVIQHFSHQEHHMKLDNVTNRAFDEKRLCQACTLPICDDIIYSCMQCDFTLHKECAHLPRRKQHVTHPHPLSLRTDNQKGCFRCTTCNRHNSGFMYLCCERDCNFILDVRCASISEPVDHWCHPHPMFLTFKLDNYNHCSSCRENLYRTVNCVDCDFDLCFECATLPSKMGYKFDEHYLFLSYNKDARCQSLCDVCEQKADPKKKIYMCNVCEVIVHIECLLGENMYLRPDGVINFEGVNVNILLNSRLTRYICRYCDDRCEEKIVYKISDREILCSERCLLGYPIP